MELNHRGLPNFEQEKQNYSFIVTKLKLSSIKNAPSLLPCQPSWRHKKRYCLFLAALDLMEAIGISG